MTVFGSIAGLQHTSLATSARCCAAGGASVSPPDDRDHFYAANASSGTPECHEAVATHAALACDTSRRSLRSLVYVRRRYRHPAVLAKRDLRTIDPPLGRRADVGVGAGWAQVEYDAYGIPFPSVKERMDLLRSTCSACADCSATRSPTSTAGTSPCRDARCEPKPLQADLPIWVGGSGEKRTLRIAARYADGWNVPFVDPATFAAKREILHQHCADVGRTRRRSAPP